MYLRSRPQWCTVVIACRFESFFCFSFYFWSHLYLPASGQAVVTGVVPSHPRYVPSFLSRIWFSVTTARRFSSNVASSRFRAFRESNCAQEKFPVRIYTSMHSGGLELTRLTYVAGTRITCYTTGATGI